jgi:hypothetical protein
VVGIIDDAIIVAGHVRVVSVDCERTQSRASAGALSM